MGKRRNKSERKKKRVSAGTRGKRIRAQKQAIRAQRSLSGFLLPGLNIFPMQKMVPIGDDDR